MTDQPALHLFEGVGIELEYMIVDSQSLDVRPISDELLKAVNGSYYPEYLKPGICWSNELVTHVIELKTCHPFATAVEALPLFMDDIVRINEILAPFRARLMPGGAHPWMDPFRETKLWPHHFNRIYEAYNKIFDCRGHGWANLQSMHINLPFGDDEEFGRLHAAIRVLLPIMPALSASTPIVDATVQESLDFRMEVYRTNSRRIPSLTGQVIPEPVFSRADYEKTIFARMYEEIRPHDPENILQDEWLNARGAIARFDRSAIEIRILDLQECPAADLAIATLISNVLKCLATGEPARLAELQTWPVAPLAAILFATIKEGDRTRITDRDYLRIFGLEARREVTAGEIWQHLYEGCDKASAFPDELRDAMGVILEQGCLARRLLRQLSAAPSQRELAAVYGELCNCLAQGRMFQAP